jgi:uncharacterized protein YfdQ (DUF2303 family)
MSKGKGKGKDRVHTEVQMETSPGIDAHNQVLEQPRDDGTVLLAVVGDDQRVEVLTAAMNRIDRDRARPRRRTGTYQLATAEAFQKFVVRFKTKDTIIYANHENGHGSFTAVLNAHPAGADDGSAGWEDFTARYRCEMTDDFMDWSNAAGNSFGKIDLCMFLDRHHHHLVEHEGYPKPAQVLDWVRKIRIRVRGEYEESYDARTGSQVLVMKNETTEESTPVIDPFCIGVPIFHGGKGYRIEVRVEMQVKQSVPTFRLRLHNEAKWHQSAFEEEAMSIGEATGCELFHGSGRTER